MSTLPNYVHPLDENQHALAVAIRVLSDQLRQWIADGRAECLQPLHGDGESMLLDRLCNIFQLSAFERRVLLAAAAVEVDSAFAGICAEAQGDQRANYPTFQLLLSAFADAHWDAISPSAPLRAWRLIGLVGGETIVGSRIRIDERILHYLLGVPCENAGLAGIWHPMKVSRVALPASQDAVATRAAALLASHMEQALPVVQFLGADIATRQSVAAVAAARAGLQLGRVAVHLLPSSGSDLQIIARMLDREAALDGLAIYIPLDDAENAEGTRAATIAALTESGVAPVIIAAEDPQKFASRETVLFELGKPAPAEQCLIWQQALGTRAASLNGSLDRLSTHFHLSAEVIHRYSAMAASLTGEVDGSAESTPGEAESHAFVDTLWNICRVQSRVRMDKLAQRVDADSGWGDLVLPENEIATLKTIASQMQHRLRVHERWGFKGSGGRGMGLTAIFAGLSGTGKTTAAEVLAKELNLDLFRVDLSHTISKYIGETSRNLRRVFDAAEEAGAILLFDEADALFGKRSEVRDSHDRYANAEVSYLLQRMELYRGLAVLATNMKQAIDAAFTRRVRFVVQFPFPDPTMREAIWRRALPQQAPTHQLNYSKLARLSMTGANIRNIALNGAFLAADAGEPIRMAHLLEAARSEAAKLERPLAEQEIRGWV
jgi:hypothetical protein